MRPMSYTQQQMQQTQNVNQFRGAPMGNTMHTMGGAGLALLGSIVGYFMLDDKLKKTAVLTGVVAAASMVAGGKLQEM